MSPELSIVVPVYNESANVPELLSHLKPYQDKGYEVILVDGQSTDDSFDLIQAQGFTVICSERSRALQMNQGARHATGDILLFLHADTRLPDNADALIVQALAKPNAVWGRFDAFIVGRHPLLKVVARMMNWRSRLTGIATGDQAIFVRRTVFESSGGYAQQPLMEDVELCRRLLKLGKPECLTAKIATSGRRWEQRGVVRTIVLMWQLRWAYWRGANPEDLARRYR